MPNIKSQKDRVLQTAKEQAHNKEIKSNLKTVVKKANAAIADNAADKDQAAGRARELFHARRGNRLPRIVRGRTRRRAA